MKDRRTRAELLEALKSAHASVEAHMRETQRLGSELSVLKNAPPRVQEVLPQGWPAFIGEAYAAGYEACRRAHRGGLPDDEDR